MSLRWKCVLVFLALASSTQASVILSEGFDNIATLAGGGWAMVNNSNPVGLTGWFQGNAGVFTSQAGAGDSYIGANYNNAAFPAGGNISNWLLTPTLTLGYDTILRFYTRTESGSQYPDRLEVRLSTNGASTDVGSTDTSVGDFTVLLATINPSLAVGGYPESWSLVSAELSNPGIPLTGRFGLRYFVTDNLTNANYIGIDSLTADAVPEPSTLAFAAIGLAVVSGIRLRRRSRRVP
jgi:hypothetical protein